MKEFEHMTQVELREEVERLRVANARLTTKLAAAVKALRAVAHWSLTLGGKHWPEAMRAMRKHAKDAIGAADQ